MFTFSRREISLKKRVVLCSLTAFYIHIRSNSYTLKSNNNFLLSLTIIFTNCISLLESVSSLMESRKWIKCFPLTELDVSFKGLLCPLADMAINIHHNTIQHRRKLFDRKIDKRKYWTKKVLSLYYWIYGTIYLPVLSECPVFTTQNLLESLINEK